MRDALGTLLTFGVGGQFYGVDLASSDGVGPAGAVVPLPGAPAHLRGLTNRRGYVLPVFDLSTLLQRTLQGSRPSRGATWHVALLHEGSIAVVEADTPPNLLELAAEDERLQDETEGGPIFATLAPASEGELPIHLLHVPRLLSVSRRTPP